MPLNDKIITVNGKPVQRKTAAGFEIIRAITAERPDYHPAELVRAVKRVEGLNHAQRVQALAILFHYQSHQVATSTETQPNQTQNTAAGQEGYNGTRT